MSGDTKQAEALLDSGADVWFQDSEGKNALMLAAFHGHADLCTLLLNAGIPWRVKLICIHFFIVCVQRNQARPH